MNPIQWISIGMKALTAVSSIVGTLGASGLLPTGATNVMAEIGGAVGVALGFLHSITSNSSASIQAQAATDLASNAPKR